MHLKVLEGRRFQARKLAAGHAQQSPRFLETYAVNEYSIISQTDHRLKFSKSITRYEMNKKNKNISIIFPNATVFALRINSFLILACLIRKFTLFQRGHWLNG